MLLVCLLILKRHSTQSVTHCYVRKLNLLAVYVLDKCHSDTRNTSCGVLQGSILDTKLFILYINDMCNISNLVKFILFADDTNIFHTNSNQ